MPDSNCSKWICSELRLRELIILVLSRNKSHLLLSKHATWRCNPDTFCSVKINVPFPSVKSKLSHCHPPSRIPNIIDETNLYWIKWATFIQINTYVYAGDPCSGSSLWKLQPTISMQVPALTETAKHFLFLLLSTPTWCQGADHLTVAIPVS